MKIFPVLFFAISILFSASQAQVENFFVNPDSTYPGIKKIHHGHYVTVNMKDAEGKKLLISICGTGGEAEVMKNLDSVAAVDGYHAISIDYPNARNTATFVNSADRAAFDKFRQELNFGTPVSDSVDVDSLNSIVNRITRLVIYLAKTRPREGWKNFLQNGQIIWQRVTLAGHSQGAGHVGYLGHSFRVHRVIMLSGPQDFLAHFDTPAPWLSAPSKTPYGDYYAFLHDDDVYNTHHQIRDDLAVMHADSAVIYRFSKIAAFPAQARLLISDIPVEESGTRSRRMTGFLNHMSTILGMHSKVWGWLLRE